LSNVNVGVLRKLYAGDRQKFTTSLPTAMLNKLSTVVSIGRGGYGSSIICLGIDLVAAILGDDPTMLEDVSSRLRVVASDNDVLSNNLAAVARLVR